MKQFSNDVEIKDNGDVVINYEFRDDEGFERLDITFTIQELELILAVAKQERDANTEKVFY